MSEVAQQNINIHFNLYQFLKTQNPQQKHILHIFIIRKQNNIRMKKVICFQIMKPCKTEKKYLENGFQERKKDKGASVIAYIKDGMVVKAESAD